MKLVYQPQDKPKFGQMIVFALQQVLAILAATIAVPMIISGTYDVGEVAMSPAAALFGAGVGTLVYVLFTKGRSPVFPGSSFAFLGSMTAAFAGAVSAQAGNSIVLKSDGVYYKAPDLTPYAKSADLNDYTKTTDLSATYAKKSDLDVLFCLLYTEHRTQGMGK